MTVRLRRYESTDRERILALLGDVQYKGRIWEWQFEQNPFLQLFDPVVAVEGDSVIGFNGVMPVSVKYGGEEVDALWSCDFYVAAQFRGKGIGKQVKHCLFKKSPLIMTFGVSAEAAYVLEKTGWKQSDYVFSYRCRRRMDSLRALLLGTIQGCNRMRGFYRRKSYTGTVELRQELPLAAEVDALWRQVASGYDKIVHRSHAYLQWKYWHHPLASYQALVARDTEGHLEGIMVVRQHKSTVRLVDYLGPAHHLELKRALARRCRKSFPHAQFFAATTTDHELGNALCREGFYKARTRPSFYVRSTIEGDEACEQGWFLMSGDSDGELLLAAREAGFD